MAVGRTCIPFIPLCIYASILYCTITTAARHKRNTKVSTRQEQPTNECSREDFKCWCIKGVKYTNKVRKKHGKEKLFKIGPEKQLDNANSYAQHLGHLGTLVHQDLGHATREIGCQRWIGGENIAFNYAQKDIAKACVEQWESSSGHLENMLRDWFEEVVIGFHYTHDGRVYCVQTFATVAAHGTVGGIHDSRCEAVGAFIGPVKKAGGDIEEEKRLFEGNRSCRCLEVESECWFSLKRLSGGRCTPFIRAREQGAPCKEMCCEYCHAKPGSSHCRSKNVVALCNGEER